MVPCFWSLIRKLKQHMQYCAYIKDASVISHFSEQKKGKWMSTLQDADYRLEHTRQRVHVSYLHSTKYYTTWQSVSYSPCCLKARNLPSSVLWTSRTCASCRSVWPKSTGSVLRTVSWTPCSSRPYRLNRCISKIHPWNSSTNNALPYWGMQSFSRPVPWACCVSWNMSPVTIQIAPKPTSTI